MNGKRARKPHLHSQNANAFAVARKATQPILPRLFPKPNTEFVPLGEPFLVGVVIVRRHNVRTGWVRFVCALRVFVVPGLKA